MLLLFFVFIFFGHLCCFLEGALRASKTGLFPIIKSLILSRIVIKKCYCPRNVDFMYIGIKRTFLRSLIIVFDADLEADYKWLRKPHFYKMSDNCCIKVFDESNPFS